MDEMNATTAKEVITILQNTDILLLLKLPYKIIEFVEERAEKCDKEIKLKENTPLIEQEISDDAKAILTLIYRDFLCDDNEKKLINKKIQDAEQELNNPFKNKKKSNVDEIQETKALVVQKRWYQKAFEIIKKIFHTT